MVRSDAQKAAEKKYEQTHKKKRQERSSLWLFEFYPEGNPPAPENWKEIIADWLVDCLFRHYTTETLTQMGHQKSRTGMGYSRSIL